MGLTINQTYARIGIDRTPCRLEIQTRSAKLELRQKQPKVNIHTELPRVEINQYEAFASAGIKSAGALSREAAQLGYQSAMDYIAKKAEDGDMLAKVENGGDPIIDIAVRDAYPEHEFGMVTMPSAGPEITVKGSVAIEPEITNGGAMNGVEGEFIPGDISFDFTPAQLKIYMAQYASVNINYQNSKVDTYV